MLDKLTPEQKSSLRRIKKGPIYDLARNMMCGGITSTGISEVYIQFDRDVRIYGLYEALLFAEQYEHQGEYAPGTVQRTIDACLSQVTCE